MYIVALSVRGNLSVVDLGLLNFENYFSLIIFASWMRYL